MELYKRVEVAEVTEEGLQEVCKEVTQIEVYTQIGEDTYYTSKVYNVKAIDVSSVGSMFINLEGSAFNTDLVLHNVVAVEFYSWENNGDTIRVITNPVAGI